MRFDGVMPRRRRPARARGPPTDRATKKKKKKARRRSEGRAGRARLFFLRRRRPARFPPALSCARARARAQQTEQIIHLFIYLLFLSLPRMRARTRRRFFLFIFRAARAAPPFEVRFGLGRGALFFLSRAQTLLGGSRRRLGCRRRSRIREISAAAAGRYPPRGGTRWRMPRIRAESKTGDEMVIGM